MAKGGYRDNAGRKKGVPNLLTHELREKINAGRLIDFLQKIVEGKIKGASITERKDAAVALLKKVLPDSKPMEPVKEAEPLILKIVRRDQNGNERLCSTWSDTENLSQKNITEKSP